MNWFLRIGAGLLLALGVAATAVAATPDGKSAATALPLSLSAGASGTLTGNAAGSYAYYTFDYPGDGSVGTITINVSPAEPTLENAVGATLYQAGLTLATMNAVSPTPGTNAVTFSSSTKGPVLVVVYNYDQGATASYRLALSGVTPVSTGPGPTPTPSFGPSPTPLPAGATPRTATPLDKSASSTLAGNPAGSFAYYTVQYPGDGSVQTVTLNYSPGGADVGTAVTLSAFQNGVTLASLNGTHGTAPGVLPISYSSTTKGTVLIQIANYNPSPTISYTISQ